MFHRQYIGTYNFSDTTKKTYMAGDIKQNKTSISWKTCVSCHVWCFPGSTQKDIFVSRGDTTTCCWNSSSISNFLRRWHQTVQRIQQIRLSNESDKSDCPMDKSAHLESSEEEDRRLSCVRRGQGECASSKKRQITVTHCPWKLLMIWYCWKT